MAYALSTQVTFEGRSREETERMLNEQVIPAVSKLPGFQSGVWLRSKDGSTGMGIVVFDTEENLKSMRDWMSASRPAEAPPITSSEIFEVTGQA